MPSGAEHALVSSDAQSTFAWRARDAEGVVCSGTMGAVSADEVAVRLREEGRYVVSIRESASGTGDVVTRDRREVRMKRDETIAFFRQISVMLSAGVPNSPLPSGRGPAAPLPGAGAPRGVHAAHLPARLRAAGQRAAVRGHGDAGGPRRRAWRPCRSWVEDA